MRNNYMDRLYAEELPNGSRIEMHIWHTLHRTHGRKVMQKRKELCICKRKYKRALPRVDLEPRISESVYELTCKSHVICDNCGVTCEIVTSTRRYVDGQARVPDMLAPLEGMLEELDA